MSGDPLGCSGIHRPPTASARDWIWERTDDCWGVDMKERMFASVLGEV